MEIRDFLAINPKITLKKAVALYDFFKEVKTVCYSENHIEDIEIDDYFPSGDKHVSVRFDLYDSSIAVGYWTGRNALQMTVCTDILPNGDYDYTTDNVKAFINNFWDIIYYIQDKNFSGF